jgi:hypothetical protein
MTLVVAGLALAVVSVGLVRLLLFGWATVAPDDARYLFVGLSTLAGHGPVTPDGNLFLLRAPVYGIALAGVGKPFGDPLTGGHIVAAALAIAGLLGAVRLGWLIGGPVAGASTAICLLAMPLVWRLLPTMRVDLPQTAGVIGVLIAIQQPTVRRWAVAGGILGLTILVKETILLLGALPVAAVGLIPPRVLAKLSLAYVLVAAAVAGWWWAVVWTQAAVIFPANAVGTIERRDVGADIRIDPIGAVIVGLSVAAWVVIAWRARRQLPARFLLVAAACLVVPAIYATLNGLSTRNYVGLAVLSAIAIGVAFATVGQALATRAGPTGRGRATTWAVIGVLLLSAAAVGQRSVGRPTDLQLPHQIANWLAPRVSAGSNVPMTFLYSEVTAVALFDSASIPKLPVFRYQADRRLNAYLWLGLRDQQLFGIRRTLWAETLSDPRTSHLVLAGPHALTPIELLPALDDGRLGGIANKKRIEVEREWAEIYVVDPAAVAAAPDVPLHLSRDAAVAWLDLKSGQAERREREGLLIQARPVLVGQGGRDILDSLEREACLVPAGEGPRTFILVPASPATASRRDAVCG